MNSPHTHRPQLSLMMSAIWIYALVLLFGSVLGFAQEEDRDSDLVAAQLKSQFRETVQPAVSYTHLTLPTKRIV